VIGRLGFTSAAGDFSGWKKAQLIQCIDFKERFFSKSYVLRFVSGPIGATTERGKGYLPSPSLMPILGGSRRLPTSGIRIDNGREEA